MSDSMRRPAVRGPYQQCPTCQQWGWPSTHVCAPEWQWRCDATHSEGNWSDGIRARDAEQAAELAAEAYDADDYTLLRGNEATIEVRPLAGGEVTRWICSGESVPHYRAVAAAAEEE